MTQADRDEILSVLNKVILKGSTPPRVISFGAISKDYHWIRFEHFHIDAKLNGVSSSDNYIYAALSEIVKAFAEVDE